MYANVSLLSVVKVPLDARKRSPAPPVIEIQRSIPHLRFHKKTLTGQQLPGTRLGAKS